MRRCYRNGAHRTHPATHPEPYPEHMKKLAALAALPLLALAACSSGSGEAAKTVTVSATPSSSSTTPSPTGTPYGGDPEFKITDAQFLAKMRANTGDKGTDDELRAIGAQTCKDLRDVGTPVEDYIRALYGTKGYTDAQIAFLVATSARAYCPTPHIEQQIRALSK